MKLAPGIFKEFLSLPSKAVLEVMGLGGGNAPHVFLLVYILTIYLINCIIHSQCIFFSDDNLYGLSDEYAGKSYSQTCGGCICPTVNSPELVCTGPSIEL